MNQIIFKELDEEDLSFVQNIYNYYVDNSTFTFHTSKLSLEELKEFIPIKHSKYKSFLIIENDEICGYCYLSQFKKRQAYDRTAELSIYLKLGYQGKGMGKKAVSYLEKVAKKKEIKVLLSIISGENTSSIKFFENQGYDKCAHYKEVGEKFGRLIDVIAYQKIPS
ncbi:MAG: N-acetyltransferase [Candidatus Lokiarchaeota archaeon]|nr:N-acetyltransferase [Candidatus Lokiarchaeota archaeon]